MTAVNGQGTIGFTGLFALLVGGGALRRVVMVTEYGVLLMVMFRRLACPKLVTIAAVRRRALSSHFSYEDCLLARPGAAFFSGFQP